MTCCTLTPLDLTLPGPSRYAQQSIAIDSSCKTFAPMAAPLAALPHQQRLRADTPPLDDDELDCFKPFDGHKPIYRGCIDTQLKRVLDDIDIHGCEANGENAFFVADLSEVYRQHLRWMRALPRIVPFYAVKCNPDPYVLQLLAALGTGFDCASNGEIEAVLKLGINPARIIYANPCKAASFVRHAATHNVGLTTFDNMDELDKMKRYHPSCKLVVRILTDDSKSACQLGLKFGAPLDSVPRLLQRARELELDVVGVSFHVGSGCYDPDSFRDAVYRARRAFDMGKEAGYTFDLLDIGGGFGHDNFEMVAGVLGPAIDRYFPDDDFAPGGKEVEGKLNGLRIIAEPGRFYVHSAFALATNIIAARRGEPSPVGAIVEAVAPTKPQVMYYQNDGLYGSFNCVIFDHVTVHPKVLTLGFEYAYRPDLEAPGSEDELQPCSVWGPTCDSIDCVRALVHLPKGLKVGDWLVYENMGAYTICAASTFNGIRRSEVRYTLGAGEDAEVVRELMM
ncbi:Orn/DAP/Arg decarboxylase 2, C-terminal [Kalmanozyma brasiliensis GHG001]|uniref:ornithine decarboxylase n=1 Tax=Kalmanozyma brasiliensis (strain GHG001) TaxID=1365824 RepID=V5EMJ2_KALBG|nr:Orn/DAP/Arg decarboxylase 2, C-terminal [Kalmanozyma brasiliensis GHG001]EST06355.1 Orn/DAP/Arg decarboxylase 2, C-terminal [Kalmanozyma brasiliensis GHG001]